MSKWLLLNPITLLLRMMLNLLNKVTLLKRILTVMFVKLVLGALMFGLVGRIS